MHLTPEEVDHIALLSRLQLSPEERERAASELAPILDYFDKLKELDTSGVIAEAEPLAGFNVFRPDEIRPSLAREATLQNAPESAAGMFQVPRVVEAD